MKDLDLVFLIKNNPEEGINRAVDIYGGLVHSICSRILHGRPKEDIEEACSDAFVRLWKNAGNYDISRKASLKTYICIMARSSAIDVCKKDSDEVLVDLAEYDILDCSLNVEDEIVMEESCAIVRSVLNDMKEPDRSIFLMRYFYFFPVKDIAEELDLPLKQVENVLYRRKKNIKKALIERGITYD